MESHNHDQPHGINEPLSPGFSNDFISRLSGKLTGKDRTKVLLQKYIGLDSKKNAFELWKCYKGDPNNNSESRQTTIL